jgi:hypothetical protein
MRGVAGANGVPSHLDDLVSANDLVSAEQFVISRLQAERIDLQSGLPKSGKTKLITRVYILDTI